MPRWSQGSKIAYTNWGFTYDSDIFVYDPATQTSTQVTHHAAGEAFNFATWSPDGEKLAVARRDPGTGLYDILIMNPDGSGSVNITAGWTDTTQNCPSWSPDGEYVLFQSDKGGNWDIWAMRPDLTGLVNLTNTPDVNEYYPAMTSEPAIPEPAIPEPVTMVALLGGIGCLGGYLRRRRR